MSAQLLEVRGLQVRYPAGHGSQAHTAVDGVSFELAAGASLGLVGESGSGKSSIARALLRLVPASGSVQFDGRDLLRLSGAQLRATREHLQIIFQDPLAALDPRMRIGEIVAEPLREFRVVGLVQMILRERNGVRHLVRPGTNVHIDADGTQNRSQRARNARGRSGWTGHYLSVRQTRIEEA